MPVSATLDSSGRFGVSVDPTNDVVEHNDTNNNESVWLRHPDLDVVDSSATRSNGTVLVTVTVANPTDVATPPFEFQFENGPALARTTRLESVPPQGTRRTTLRFDPAALTRTDVADLVADPADELPETDESNNVLTRTILQPDIVLAPGRINYYEANGTIRAVATVENVGTGAGEGLIRVRRTSDGATVATRTFEVSPAGTSGAGAFTTVTLPLPGVGGTDTLNVTATASIPESSNESIVVDRAGAIDVVRPNSILLPPNGSIHFGKTPATASQRLNVSFDGEDPDGGIADYVWSVTNATWPNDSSGGGSRIEVVPDENASTVTVTVTVIDRDDLETTVRRTIEVAPALMTPRWSKRVPGRLQHSSPAVTSDLVVLGGLDEQVTAIYRSNGSTAWTFDRDGSLVDSSPTVYEGRIIVGSGSGTLYALWTANGSVDWTVETDSAIVSSPTVSAGTVYVGSNDGTVLAVNATEGSVRWRHESNGSVFSSVAAEDDIAYVARNDGRVQALDAADGTWRWAIDTGSELGHSSPVLSGDTLYVAGDALFAIDLANRTRLWQRDFGGPGGSTPTVDDGRVYVGVDDGTVVAFDATDGSKLWTTTTNAPVQSRPTVVGDRVVVGTDAENTYLLNATTGETVANVSLGDAPIRASPTVAGTVGFVSTWDGTVTALANVGDGATDSTGSTTDEGSVSRKAPSDNCF